MDTNVFVYRIDPHEPFKRSRAREVLETVLRAGSGVVSMQVASELASVLLRQHRGPLALEDVSEWLGHIMRDWPTVLVRPRTVALALEGVDRFGFAFYDAQLWAAAKLAGASVLLSEDFTDGLDADGVLCVNPFERSFDIDELLDGLRAE